MVPEFAGLATLHWASLNLMLLEAALGPLETVADLHFFILPELSSLYLQGKVAA